MTEDEPEAKDPDTALNGALGESLITIVKEVAARSILCETGLALIMAAFPLDETEAAFPLDETEAENLLGSVGRTFFAEPDATSS